MFWFPLIIALGVIATGCSPGEPQAGNQQPAIPVFATTAEERDLPIYVEAIGVLQPQQQVEVRPQVSGVINEVFFVEGQPVEKGSPLLTIDTEGYTIQLQEAQALLLQHRAALTSTQKKRDRYHELAGKQLISQQEWEELEAQVAQLEAQIYGDKSKIAAAKLNLKRCTITAPIAGQAGKLLVHAGNFVTASQATPLVTIANTQQLNVEFTLAEKDYLKLMPDSVQKRLPIEIASLSQPEKQARATLAFIDSKLDSQTGLMLLRANLANEEKIFTAGQHVNVRVPVQLIRNACVVPQKAIKINQLGPYLFAVKDDATVEIRPLRLGCESGSHSIVILSGITPGEKVITEGHLRLAPGLKVDVKEQPPEPERRP